MTKDFQVKSFDNFTGASCRAGYVNETFFNSIFPTIDEGVLPSFLNASIFETLKRRNKTIR